MTGPAWKKCISCFSLSLFLESRDCLTCLYIYHCRSAISQKLCTEELFREHGEALFAVPSAYFCRRYVSFILTSRVLLKSVFSCYIQSTFVCGCWDLEEMHISFLISTCSHQVVHCFSLSSCFQVLNICTRNVPEEERLTACLFEILD